MEKDDDEEFFLRLRKEKGFANEVLYFEPHLTLKRAFDLLAKDPGKRDEIISSIGYSIDKYLTSVDKIKVIHSLIQSKADFSVIGLRNLYILKSEAITEFINKLNDLLEFISFEEEVKIKERSQLLKMIKGTSKKKKKTPTGFKSNWNKGMIELLHKSLLGSHIDSKVTLKQFETIFKEEPLPDSFSIEWEKSNVLLAYLVFKVFHDDNLFDLWTKAEHIFTKMGIYLKHLNQSYDNSPKPKGHKIIDEILKNIYTHLG